jgi:hypothetical protein
VSAGPACAADGEFLAQLHQKVGAWLSRATDYQQANVTDALENLASCPSDVIATGGTVITWIDGVRIRFAEVPLAEEKYCVVLLEPEERALDFDEARDLQTALIVQPEQDLNEIARKDSAAASRNEELFSQLRTVAKNTRANEPKKTASFEPDSKTFVDCQKADTSGALAETAPLQSKQIQGTLYEWKEIPVRDREICIYLSVPIRRGLAKAEAEDFALVVHDSSPPAVSPPSADLRAAEKKLPLTDVTTGDGGGSVEQADYWDVHAGVECGRLRVARPLGAGEQRPEAFRA